MPSDKFIYIFFKTIKTNYSYHFRQLRGKVILLYFINILAGKVMVIYGFLSTEWKSIYLGGNFSSCMINWCFLLN